jgi:thiamine-phosphate pyrophosphorylase
MTTRDEARPCGVYLLTPDLDDTARLLATTRAALAAGVRVVQYRHKDADAALRLAQARALRELTAVFGARLIVNDDLDLALAVRADGLHAGRDDGDPARLRALLPAPLVLGISCYASFDAAQDAIGAGADYVAFGSVFASPTKPDAVRAPLALLTRARQAGWHVVAIGGIDATNIAQVAGAGGHAAALITAVFNAADPSHAARTLVDQFERGRNAYESERVLV